MVERSKVEKKTNVHSTNKFNFIVMRGLGVESVKQGVAVMGSRIKAAMDTERRT